MEYTVEMKSDHLLVSIMDEDTDDTASDYIFKIKRVKRVNRNKMLPLFDGLIEAFLYHTFAIGNVISDDGCWKKITHILKYIPITLVSGTIPKDADINEYFIELIEDNDDLLVELIFTTAWNKQTKQVDLGYDQSFTEAGYIIKLNSLDFLELMSQQAAKAGKRQQARKVKFQEMMDEMNPTENEDESSKTKSKS